MQMMETNALPVRLPGAQPDTLMWARPVDVEPQALDQLRNISRLPWVHGLQVMPDVHLGKGSTVGSVVAMRNAVSPAAVGVDIGVGMQAVRTSLTTADLPDDLHALLLAVEAAIPVGFSAHKSMPEVNRLKFNHGRYAGWDRFWKGFGALHDDVQDREKKAKQQMGSLGGGNHFIELTSDDDGQVWLMLHSGSRNIGKEIAERHISRPRTSSTTWVCPTPTWRCSCPAPRRWTPTSATCTGTGVRRPQPRRDVRRRGSSFRVTAPSSYSMDLSCSR
jgi:tRNA-splicing ligase RtcB (3'-phosphate/5'-hydroxy nucleic acid ligase)